MAGRPGVRSHDLRHTAATYAAPAGATFAELMARVGRSCSQAAVRYQHATKDRDPIVADALSDIATAKVVTLRPGSG
jgi:integrase